MTAVNPAPANAALSPESGGYDVRVDYRLCTPDQARDNLALDRLRDEYGVANRRAFEIVALALNEQFTAS